MFATLAETAAAVRSGTVSSRELVAHALAAADRLDPVLGAYVTRFPEEALLAAKRADAATAAGEELGPLHGVPLAVKDNLATAEGPTTGQSPAHDPRWWLGRDADAVAALRAAGAIVLGKTTMAEYAVGRPEPAHTFPVPRNPWDVDRWTGGSSCGNGAGIAAGLFPAALGTDTAGSVRLPAALCGITGLKTTYGLVPRAGLLPLSWSQDVVGPMAATAHDCALLLDTLTPRPAATDLPDRIRIRVPEEVVMHPGVLPATRAAFDTALLDLRATGAEIVPFPLPEFPALQAANAVTMLTEAFAAHGTSLAAAWTTHGRSFRRVVGAGALIPGHLYLRAQRARAAALSALLARLGPYDVIATPTWPSGARRYTDEPALPGDEFNPAAAWNAAGLPALALPMGADPDGMPLSLQLVGRPGADGLLLALGMRYQSGTEHHRRRPAVDPAAVPLPLPDPDAADSPARPAEDRVQAIADALGTTPSADDLAVLAGFGAMLGPLADVLGTVGPDVEPILGLAAEQVLFAHPVT
ncbi:MAG: amidase [Streptomycetaceae bacterium]|nr:amidase [Streptomycetaceae bacterium]